MTKIYDNVESHLRMAGILFLLLRKIRQEGMMAIESDIDDPESSALFNAFGEIDFTCQPAYVFSQDVLRLMIGGHLDSHEMDSYMENYRETTVLDENQSSLFTVARITLAAGIRGYAPHIAIEFGRQGFPAQVKPTFNQMYAFLKSLQKQPQLDQDFDAQLDKFLDSIGA